MGIIDVIPFEQDTFYYIPAVPGQSECDLSILGWSWKFARGWLDVGMEDVLSLAGGEHPT